MMPFWYHHKFYPKIQKKKKGEGSYMIKELAIPHCLKHNLSTKRVSLSTLTKKRKGSITVEAALAIPLFLFAVLSLVFLFEIAAIKINVKNGLYAAGKIASQEAYLVKMVIPAKVEADLVEYIGRERLNQSIVEQGAGGINCQNSSLSLFTGEGKLVAEYQVIAPFPGHLLKISQREEIKIKGWVGYKGGLTEDTDEKLVYMTETGLVYHLDYNCTHLDLSIKGATESEIISMRNESGGKYYPCERCDEQATFFYLTKTGNRYHGNIGCSSLKRTVYSVKLSEVYGKGGCKRCSN